MTVASAPGFTLSHGFVPTARRSMVALALALALAGCNHLDEPGGYVAGWTLVDASQRHPIMVSEQPADLTLRVARGSEGLTPHQKAQVAEFFARYRASQAGDSQLVIAVPVGSANEVAAMHAVADLRTLGKDYGLTSSNVSLEPYHDDRDSHPPIRLSYLHYVAAAPECGLWPTNLAEDYRNLPYPNFGCAQQRNLAAEIVNPADLIEPRKMDPAYAERRNDVIDKYKDGKVTHADKSEDERVNVNAN
jgi:pilus assembly protein CpaD